MVTRWFDIKDKALDLRQKGKSIRFVEKKLDIPRSTLSGWFKNIILTDTQLKILEAQHQKGMIKGRKKAVLWHNKQKELRIKLAHEEAIETLNQIDFNNNNILEVALAMLYLGEGSKDNSTSMGNTNPLILKFFISSMTKIFKIHKNNITCELHLRSDQNIDEIIKYWSKELTIQREKFSAVKDKRIVKSKTYPNYHGVCVVRCAGMAVLRRIVHLGEEFSKMVINTMD